MQVVQGLMLMHYGIDAHTLLHSLVQLLKNGENLPRIASYFYYFISLSLLAGKVVISS